MRKSLVLFIVFAVSGCVPDLFSSNPLPRSPSEDVAVVDFDSCVAAGNPVAASYPPQCRHNGVNYVGPR